ncbi:cytidine deaminase [Chitinophagaceae bacterium LWZ2-11]
MSSEKYSFEYEVFDSIDNLNVEDASLLKKARETTDLAYAPYSNFHVGAAAKLNNGEVVIGSNQENASFPVGICAERSLLASTSALFPNIPIKTMAISYHNHNQGATSSRPISPCGMCRQSLLDYEGRFQQPIRLILSGQDGKVYVIKKSSMLLPFSFTGEDLK